MKHVPMITLNDGVHIPQLGLGVWQLDDAQAYESSKAALQAGNRHIDTAMIYGMRLAWVAQLLKAKFLATKFSSPPNYGMPTMASIRHCMHLTKA
ncbi:aldo/keto reductase [Pseudomonas sp.]|uniref:aldo/keto reductase n=1 Tax=Pseudomonas sp. TaxID=306 RepID=UPI00260508BA|nr:aldo/keto reductase [Pseudomonas sp.]